MSETTKRWTVFFLSIASSIGVFLYYVFVSPEPENASRGGDVGLALTLGFIFVTHDYGSQYFRILTRSSPDTIKEFRNIRERKARQNSPLPEPTLQEVE